MIGWVKGKRLLCGNSALCNIIMYVYNVLLNKCVYIYTCMTIVCETDRVLPQ